MSEPNEPIWITYEQAIAIHSRQLRRFGGAPGLRDEGMLRSALERPINKWRYEQADLAEQAAAYAFGLAKNHAFIDGNKRIAFMAMVVFLLPGKFRPGPLDRHPPPDGFFPALPDRRPHPPRVVAIGKFARVPVAKPVSIVAEIALASACASFAPPEAP